MKNIYLLILILFSLKLSAQDLVVTTKDIIYVDGICSTNGRITFNATGGSIDNLPTDIIVTSGPTIGTCIASVINLSEGFPIVPATIFDCNFSFLDCAGEYCFAATNADECTINFCVSIDIVNCYWVETSFGLRYLACPKTTSGEPPAKDNVIDPGYDPGFIYAKGSTDLLLNSEENEYTLYTGLEPAQIQAAINNIEAAIERTVKDYNTKGYSEYEVLSQNEIKSEEDDYVFKFDNNGNLIWVYSNTQKMVKEENLNTEADKSDDIESKIMMDVRKGLAPTKKSHYTLNDISIFPNPFNQNINIAFLSETTQKVNLSIVSTLGQQMLHREFEIIKGENQLEWNIHQNLVNGIYILILTDDKGNQYTQQLIHVND